MQKPERWVYALLGGLLLIAVGYMNWNSWGGGGGGGGGFRIPIPWLQPRMGFIGRNGTQFVDLENGLPVYINGWNSYWLMSSEKRTWVSEMLRRGREMGLTVCRTWAFSDGGPKALQLFPGHYDEQMFQALDYVIYEARRNNVRLILCLLNNLNAFGGKDQYVRWAQEAGFNVTTSSDAFFSFDVIRGYFKDYIKAIVTRRNSYSGVRYYDEPAIFAWELMNEPRCVSKSSAPILQDWIIDMSSHIKSLDKKHLVTIGLEGFYGPGRTERLRVNPGEWAATFGSDFLQNSADEHIDFASVHAYPDSWIPRASLEEKVKYLSSWVDSHVNDSQNVLKKPVLFLEFGSNLRAKKNGTYEKNVLLNVVYDKVYESAKKGQAGAGALIWQLMVEGMQNYRDEFSLIAWENPSTYKLIVQQSCRLLRLFQRLKKISKPCSDFQP
ncbi:mannan endo-1,4-beta-mannosidase 6 isoform X1 [Elaeis guineensis]|uniref:mannan endo-1,4-beta-mannosidase n=1 Tax=Elaeis guineensis var. tenera TaxID=51953 RepID=A0A6I9RLB6_ELAGV|nr:mannan endo-1,4-beta-mannosidase 6 [Elaeis guineensis]